MLGSPDSQALSNKTFQICKRISKIIQLHKTNVISFYYSIDIDI